MLEPRRVSREGHHDAVETRLPALRLQKPHYMSGGRPGESPIWDPVGFTKDLPAEESKVRLQRERNNGRLAMIGAASFWSATFLDGSVPALTGAFHN